MKVIFLDNDGVICLGSNFGSRFKKQKRTGKKGGWFAVGAEGTVSVGSTQ